MANMQAVERILEVILLSELKVKNAEEDIENKQLPHS